MAMSSESTKLTDSIEIDGISKLRTSSFLHSVQYKISTK
jgi:hypothetical protein